MTELAGQDFAKKEAMTDRIVTVLLIADVLLLALTMWLSKNALLGGAACIAGSSVGAIIGLLFGIPKRRSAVANEGTALGAHAPARIAISANTSLEEVSDWITKTIVGVGLVSFAKILTTLDTAGSKLGIALFGAGANALPGGVSILISSSTLGALAAYLWFSRYLPSEFDQAFESVDDRNIHGLSQQPQAVAPVAPTATFDLADDAMPGPSAGHDDVVPELLGDDAKLREAVKLRYAQMRRAPYKINDWVKGMFGGRSEVTNAFGRRKLVATVKTAARNNYQIEIVVQADPPPATEAVFFLHNTFANTTPAVSFLDCKAVLDITAYGAFTVGVLTDDGTTELELDLAELAGVPKAFRDAD